MRLLKWISFVLAGLVVLTLLGVLAIVWFVDPNGFKPRIEAAVKGATGRDFALVGDIELGFFPWLALRTGEGRFGNAPGFGPEPMVSWKGAQLGAKLFPLLRGELIADRVRLEGAEVHLVRRADGSANWEGIGGNEPADPNAKPMEVRIDGVEIRNGRVSYVDETVPRRVEVTALNLTTDEIAPGEPFTDSEIAGVLHMDGFAPVGVPFRLEVPKALLSKNYSSVEVKEYTLSFGQFEAEGGISGTLGEQSRFTGKVESNEFDPRALLTTVGIAAPKTTDPGALGKLRFQGSWAFDRGAIAIKPLALTLDDTHFTGDFLRGAGADPVGEIALHGDALNISRYIPPSDPASEPFVLPTAMLKDLKFRGVLELESATYDDISMKGVTLRLILDEQGLRGASSKPGTAP
ncbi:MAG TPA: AsmA family protein [Steroidobacteraceae bacterium]|nr:AsmA family protein [Steroidobacteraceae bacterium]